MAQTLGHREQKKAQDQREPDMDDAQVLRRHDVVGRIEVEQRHQDGETDPQGLQPALEMIDRAFLLLDVRFRCLQGFFTDGGQSGVRWQGGLGHSISSP